MNLLQLTINQVSLIYLIVEKRYNQIRNSKAKFDAHDLHLEERMETFIIRNTVHLIRSPMSLL